MKKQAVLSLSGGMDSSTLLLHLLTNDYQVTALSFDYGQKHKVELERAVELVKYINDEWSKIHPTFDNDKNYQFYTKANIADLNAAFDDLGKKFLPMHIDFGVKKAYNDLYL
jgi:7-cyano-7-deazaguanine synthase in queuosine biosynthesis